MLESMIDQICDMVHKDQFNQCLVTLGLRDPPASSDAATGGGVPAATPSAPNRYAQVCIKALWLVLEACTVLDFHLSPAPQGYNLDPLLSRPGLYDVR